MSAITELTNIDYVQLFIAICAVMFGVKAVWSLFEWFVEKLGLETQAMRKRREDHDTLVQTVQNLATLQQKHEDDNKELKECLSAFITETRNGMDELREKNIQYSENRVHDREQSRDIQHELVESIKTVADGQAVRDKQIEAVMEGVKELLGDKIDQKYTRYINFGGIPENEVDEFDDLHQSYHNCGGNHNRDAKYSYVKEHLPVIPVETILLNHKNN